MNINAKSARCALRAGQPVTVYLYGRGGFWCADVKALKLHMDDRISIVTTTGYKVERKPIEWYRFRAATMPITKETA